MFKSFLKMLVVGLVWQSACGEGFGGEAPSVAELQGKWSGKRPGQDGAMMTEIIEIDQQKLTFQLIGEDGRARFFARGTAKTSQLGPFKLLQVSGTEHGASREDLKPANDDYAMIYVLEGDALTLAWNFDKTRKQKPAALTYTRAAASGEDKLAGKWKLSVTLGDATRDYEMRLTQADGKLKAVMISPRSGEHPAKTATFKDGQLLLEVDREIESNTVTFVYTAKVTGEQLAGKLVVKGAEDQYSGTWEGRRSGP